MEQFRPIDGKENLVALKMYERGKKPLPLALSNENTILTVVYLVDDDELWTKCLLRWSTPEATYLTVGVAKRANYRGVMHDKPSGRGEEIAFYRALKAGFDDDLVLVR